MREIDIKEVLDGELFYCTSNNRFFKRRVSGAPEFPYAVPAVAGEDARDPGKFVYFHPLAKVIV